MCQFSLRYELYRVDLEKLNFIEKYLYDYIIIYSLLWNRMLNSDTCSDGYYVEAIKSKIFKIFYNLMF